MTAELVKIAHLLSQACWITSAQAATWFVPEAVLGLGVEAAEVLTDQVIGLGGFVALAAGTAVEAGLTVKKVHKD